MSDIQPGDVIAVSTPGGVFTSQWWIRFGAALRNKPNLSNHIVVAHHWDAQKTLWGIEGRPGGVGWVDCTGYLRSAGMVNNAAQLKSTAQRAGVCLTMKAMLGTPYDWDAITADAASDCGITLPGWNPDWTGTVPGHVVCSSVAEYAYVKNGLKAPKGDRGCQPADWDEFIVTEAWV